MKKIVNWFYSIDALLFAIMLTSIILFSSAYAAHTADKYQFGNTTEYIVQRGDTLWTIAEPYTAQDQDIRQVIYTIKQLSNIGSNIQPGDKLLIPVYNKGGK